MKLQVLVPQYKETEEEIRPLLDSIEIQQNIDLKNEVGAIIVNDGSDVILSDEFLGRYTYDIQYIKNPKHGAIMELVNATSADDIQLINYPIEEWKDIAEYEGLYMVSSYGRIKSLPRKRKKRATIIKPSFSKSGYSNPITKRYFPPC